MDNIAYRERRADGYLLHEGDAVFADTLSGLNTLVITALDDPASPLIFKADFVSDPVFLDDGRVQAAVLRGLEIVRLEVEL